MKTTICIAEDRVICEPSVKLLILSLNRYCPKIAINLFYPPAGEAFLSWVKKFPQVCMQSTGLTSGIGWNIKPQAILRLMDLGYDEVIWVDSDVLVNRNILKIFSALGSDVVAVTEHTLGARERFDGDARRARAWGLPVGRDLRTAVCSGVFRVTKDHYHLMERWWELLRSDLYQDFQKKDWYERPDHMLGDQDVLTALLTSKEFAHIPLFVLRRGRHIIQFDGIWGYTVAERMMNLLGCGPAFIHSAAAKPWSDRWRLEPPTAKEYIKKVYLDLSPYTLLAMRFRYELECDTTWMRPHYRLSRILRATGGGHSALVGLPMAVIADLARMAILVLKGQEPNPA